MNIGKSIKVSCAKTGKTQIELAKAMEVSEQTVSSWVKAYSHPNIYKVFLMASFFGVKTSDFIKEGEK